MLIAAHLGKRKGIATEEIFPLALWVVFAGTVGARLIHVIDRWEYYAGNPLQILQLQHQGIIEFVQRVLPVFMGELNEGSVIRNTVFK